MVKITKRVVEAAEAQEKDYLIWDDELPGFEVPRFHLVITASPSLRIALACWRLGPDETKSAAGDARRRVLYR
jgi:hypothetical protein